MSSDIYVTHYAVDPTFKYETSYSTEIKCLVNIDDVDKAFIFNTCNRRTAVGSLEGTSISPDAYEIGGLLSLVDDTTVKIESTYADDYHYRYRWEFEVWEYKGPTNGPNEFIVRGHIEVELNGIDSTTVDVSSLGIADAAKTVPFINGIAHSCTSNGADGLTAIAYLLGASSLKVKRGAGTSDNTKVGITLVEFTGSNWTIRQAQKQSGDDDGDITLPTSVNNWENAFIYHQFKANSANHVDDAIADTSAVYYPGDLQTVHWEFDSQHVDSVGDSIHYIFVIENPEITVYRSSDTQSTNKYMDIDFGITNLPAAKEASMMVSRTSSGTGTAYPRGWAGAIYTGKKAVLHATYEGNTIQSEVQLIHFGNEYYDPTNDTYSGAILKNLDIDNYWSFQNFYHDFGLAETFMCYTNLNNYGFVSDGFRPRGHKFNLMIDGENTNSRYFLQGCNSPTANFDSHTERLIGGWIMLDSIQVLQSMLYKEGGGANNIAILIGFGNKLMAQVDRSSGTVEYVQVYSNMSLKANRPYHVCLLFKAGEDVKLLIDGKLQEYSFGNPWTTTEMPSHTGPRILGSDEAIDAGGPDLTFYTPTKAYYADWFSADNVIDIDTIEMYGVQHGLPADVSLPDTNMQSVLDTYANTVMKDYPLSFRIPAPYNSNDLTLEADNIIMHEDTTYHIQWLGTGKLIWKNKGSSNISKYSILFGGQVEILNEITITITVVDAKTFNPIEDAAVYFEDLAEYELTNSQGEVIIQDYLPMNSVHNIKVRKGSAAPYYKANTTQVTITSRAVAVTVPLIPDN